eukprot:Hpha_TRINITY_DN30707_c0_g1::TRINITY_DN30707_c0_g1_i1::g.28445::m.28445/K11752/ribD; diaminohydroxyphosphoribosylaminopyrimidine deaminase / 5-amino-6-(5-phosphoribosylamino)uracil reductase
MEVPAAKRPRPADEHEGFMMEAVAEGEKGRVTAPPNPHVGCVLVRDGRVVARGYHRKAGQAHAEVEAIRDAQAKGESTKGTTAYVTLEPCSHFGRTGPCCVALHEAGVARVFVACPDPDPRVSGRGAAYLEERGIPVTMKVCEEAGERSLRSYLHQRRSGLPFVVLKTALTIDGCIACGDGTSQWITKEEARKAGHMIRAESQAVVVGSGTALADNPRLTVRLEKFPDIQQPLRVLLDRRGRVTKGNLMDTSQAPTLVVTTPLAPPEARAVWEKAGVEVLELGDDKGPEPMLRFLAKKGILQVMVEGGGEVHADFLSRGFCDRLVVFQGATVFGNGRRWLPREICATISDAKFLKLDSVQRHGDDVCMEYVRATK